MKFVLDSLNSVAYVDDGQVCAIKAIKLYTEDYPIRNTRPLPTSHKQAMVEVVMVTPKTRE